MMDKIGFKFLMLTILFILGIFFPCINSCFPEPFFFFLFIESEPLFHDTDFP